MKVRIIIFFILLSLSYGCNFQRFFRNISITNISDFPTHFRCTTDKGMLFGADIPRTPSADYLTSYISNDTLDFYLDFPIPENDEENPYLIIKYSHEITFHNPLIHIGENNTKSSEYGTTKIYKSGEGVGGWPGRNNEGFISGDLKEKSKIEYLKPEGETGETDYDLWFVGYENFFHNKHKSMNQPEIKLCIYTGHFDEEKIKSMGEFVFSDFCSLPEYAYLVCKPR